MKPIKLIMLIFIILTSCTKTQNTISSTNNNNVSTAHIDGKFCITSEINYGGINKVFYSGYLRNSNNQNINCGNIYCNSISIPYNSMQSNSQADGGNYTLSQNNQSYSGSVAWKFDGYNTNNIPAFTFNAKLVTQPFGIADTLFLSKDYTINLTGITGDSVMCSLSNNNFTTVSINKENPTSVIFHQSDFNKVASISSNNGSPVNYLTLKVEVINYSYDVVNGKNYQFISTQIVTQTIQIK